MEGASMALKNGKIGCAVVGYGPTFNFGWMHCKWISAVPDMRLLSICDRDPQRAALAREDWPNVDVSEDLDAVLARDDIDMVAVVTAHNTHAALVIKCLEAGKHTVVDKPMCITVAEATAMIEAGKRAGKTLGVFHNRRHDGNVRAMKAAIEEGLIGRVFDIELSACGYGRPGDAWRSRKEVSGGLMYDWGSHAIDWVLSMVPSPMAQITGFFFKLVWEEATNEDQTQAIVRFENGTVAKITQSNIDYAGKPLWRILGTEGAIVDTGAGSIEGYCKEIVGPPGGSFAIINGEGRREVPYMESDWVTHYMEMADHLLRGGPVPVSGEDGRRVITVLETAEKSSKEGRSLTPEYP
jgi:predicted dehydrogenase